MKTTILMLIISLMSAVCFSQDVQIGTQTWKSANQDNGTGVYYTDKGITYTQFGKLYTKAEATLSNATEGAQGVCGEGWHIPTSADVATLVAFLGGNPTAGRYLRSTGNTDWFTPFTWPGYTPAYRAYLNSILNGWDTFGFSLKPSGYQNKYGGFAMMGKYAYFWTSSMIEGNDTYIYNGYSSGAVWEYRGYVADPVRFPVRCIKN